MAPAYKLDVSGDVRVQGQGIFTGTMTVQGSSGGYGLTISSNVALAGALYTGSGNVGIGTTSPGAKLDVAGLIQASSASFTTTGNGANNVGLRVSSSGYLATDGGYVGIGTTNPAYKLDVAGIVNAAALYVGGSPYIGSQWTTAGTSIYYNTGNVGIGTTVPGYGLEVINTAGVHLSTTATAGYGLYLNSAGSVGIGTTSPAYQFEVVNPANSGVVSVLGYGTGLSMGGAFYGRAARGTPASPEALQADDLLIGLGGKGYNGASWTGSRAVILMNAAETWTAGSNPAYMTFGTTPSGSTGFVERMRIDQNGNVGIGTTAPQELLQVNGNIRLGGAAGSGLYKFITPTDSGFSLGNNNSNSGYNSAAVGGYNTVSLNNSGAYGLNNTVSNLQGYAFGRANSVSADNAISIGASVSNTIADSLMIGPSNTAKITILTSGNVGIGTTNPATALDVNGVSNAATGFRVANAATSGNFLRGNGTNFVSSAIQAGDLPSALFANPTATIGLSAANGTAATAMRSDAAPALSQAITPTWTGTHTFSNGTYSALFTGGNVGIGTTAPATKLHISSGVVTVDGTGAGITTTGNVTAAYYYGDGSNLTNVLSNAPVKTLAEMNTLVPAAAGRLISVSNAAAPYSYCVSTGTLAGAWVLLNQTLHCQ